MIKFSNLNRLNDLPINIGNILLKNDILAKSLKHNTKDALIKNITIKEKQSLINQSDSINRRILFQPFNDETISDERSELRIYIFELNSENHILSEVIIGFEIIVNNELWLLNNGKQRALIILEELFKSLNDVDINGIGSLRFYNDYPCRIRFYNKNFTGYNLMMKTRLT